MRVRSKVSKDEVEYRDEYPKNKEEREIFKYACPVCLRYFNKMLISSCCNNYLCRLCIGNMAKKAKGNKDYTIYCPHCTANDFKLDDVKPDA